MNRLEQLTKLFEISSIKRLDPEAKRPLQVQSNEHDCNYGIMTGIEHNLTVIDIDNSPDKKGSKWLKKYADFKPDKECIFLVQTPHGFHYYFKHSQLLGGTKHYNKIGIDIQSGNSYVVAPYSIVRCDKDWCANYGQLEGYKLIKDNSHLGKGNIPSTTILFHLLEKTRKLKKSRKPKKKDKSVNKAIWNSKLSKVTRREVYGKEKHKGNTQYPLKSIDTFDSSFNPRVKSEFVQFPSTILSAYRKMKPKVIEPQKVFEELSDNDIANTISEVNMKKKKELDFNNLILKCIQGVKSARKYAKKHNINWKLFK